MLNEIQAWFLVKRLWENSNEFYYETGILYKGRECYGLCRTLSEIHNDKIISDNIVARMRRKLTSFAKRYDKFGYFWPKSKEGAVQRVKFCKNRIKQLRKVK